MATENFSIFVAPRSFCTCGDPSCRSECNLLPVEDVSDLIDAGVWEQRLCWGASAGRSQGAAQPADEMRRKRTPAEALPVRAEPVVEDAADLFAAQVWEYKLM